MAMYLGGAAIVEADRLNDEITKTEEDEKDTKPINMEEMKEEEVFEQPPEQIKSPSGTSTG